jgi:phosphoribosyl 1,2-cyclic phosphodiesterase
MEKKKQTRFEGKIEPLTDLTAFYMVVVEDSIYPPKEKHLKYDDAFSEMLRLSKKENKKAFVLLSIAQAEQIPNVTIFRHKYSK